MKVSDAAETLAIQICGCADARQRKADVAAILAYRDACIREGIEMAAKVADETESCGEQSEYAFGYDSAALKIAERIRALAGEVK